MHGLLPYSSSVEEAMRPDNNAAADVLEWEWGRGSEPLGESRNLDHVTPIRQRQRLATINIAASTAPFPFLSSSPPFPLTSQVLAAAPETPCHRRQAVTPRRPTPQVRAVKPPSRMSCTTSHQSSIRSEPHVAGVVVRPF